MVSLNVQHDGLRIVCYNNITLVLRAWKKKTMGTSSITTLGTTVQTSRLDIILSIV